MKSYGDLEQYDVDQLKSLVLELSEKVEELERHDMLQRRTPAGIREAYSITKRMQSDWEQIDRMELTIQAQSEYIHGLQEHIQKLAVILDDNGLGDHSLKL